MREPIPGKSRALNRLVPLAKANVLAFLDDDVEVAPEWLRITWQFFGDYSYDVMQGSILIPPSMQNDQVSSAAQSLSDDLLLQQTRS